MTRTFKIVTGTVLLLSSFLASSTPIRTGFDSSTFARNDDSSILVNTGINFDFYGLAGPSVYLNNNGNLTFGSALSTFTPTAITAGSTPLIAAFFADVNTNSNGLAVTYGSGNVGAFGAYGFNWLDVAAFGGNASVLNSFQIVLIDRSDTGAGNFDFEFNYGSINWDTGSFSDNSAAVGYTNGAGTFFQLPGSLESGAFLDSNPLTSLANNSLNSNTLGRYAFSVRESSVSNPASVSEPGTIGLMGLALLALVRLRKANKR